MTAGAEGRPKSEGALLQHNCKASTVNTFINVLLTYPFGGGLNCPVKSSTKCTPKDLNFLQRHKVIVQEDVDPLCRSCGEDKETSHHVVAECPCLRSHSTKSPWHFLFTKVRSTGRCRLLSSFGKLISALCKIKE